VTRLANQIGSTGLKLEHGTATMAAHAEACHQFLAQQEATP
jgi:hypothetical protein